MERKSGAEPMVDARYDGLAEWYDDNLKQPLYDDVPEHVCRLVPLSELLTVGDENVK